MIIIIIIIIIVIIPHSTYLLSLVPTFCLPGVDHSQDKTVAEVDFSINVDHGNGGVETIL